MAERGNSIVILRSAILTQLGAHASTSALQVNSTQPASWPASDAYVVVTNFSEADEIFVGLDAVDVMFTTVSYARERKNSGTIPDIEAWTNDGYVKEALTAGTLTLDASWGMVLLEPEASEGIQSGDDAYNYYTVTREWRTRIDFTG